MRVAFRPSSRTHSCGIRGNKSQPHRSGTAPEGTGSENPNSFGEQAEVSKSQCTNAAFWESSKVSLWRGSWLDRCGCYLDVVEKGFICCYSRRLCLLWAGELECNKRKRLYQSLAQTVRNGTLFLLAVPVCKSSCVAFVWMRGLCEWL